MCPRGASAGRQFTAAHASPDGRKGCMVENTATISLTRRALLTAACVGGAGFAGGTLVSLPSALASADDVELIPQLTGNVPTESDSVHLATPTVLPNS